MTKQTNSKSKGQNANNSSGSPAIESNHDLAPAQPEEVCQSKTTYSNRKAALSKREIMEDLSRQRFPWDD